MSLTRLFVALVAASMMMFSPLDADAQTASARGMGAVAWDGWRLGPEERQEAVHRAKIAAVEAYLAETSPAQVRLFAARRDELAADIGRYVLSATMLDQNKDKKAKTYTVVVRVELNAALLQADLDSGSATAQTAAHDRSLIAILFMSRMHATVQSFDDRVYTRADRTENSDRSTNHAETVSEGEQFSDGQVELSASLQTREQADSNHTVTTTTGGSTTRRAEAVTWQVASTGEVNARMSGVFGAAGYEVVEGEYVEAESGGQLSVARIRADFSTGDDLSAEVLRATVNGVQHAGIPLLAFGTLDIGIRDTDPVSGNTRVFVNVTGRVMDVSGRFPKTVSSVGPVQFAGLGPTETVARNNALALAAESAAQVMVDEMNIRGVR